MFLSDPGTFLASLAFWILAIGLCASALSVVLSRSPVHSVFFLIFAFFNSAGLFLLLGAEFLAMILVIVYVGAVAVLFLFVVMMLDMELVILREGFTKYLPLGTVLAAILLAELILVMSLPRDNTPAANNPVTDINNTKALGELIYDDYFLLFQVSGLILLVSMVGSIVLTHRVRAGVRRQSIYDQTARAGRIRLEDPGVGEGVHWDV
ncbi:MAG: NADH-quinone oxidoreductase subunit J [Alphaproteobacteria bacterium]|nr:NADH-quinone oxidoreductase subunit J [Alphaproteobacteria bacterium]MDA7987405.1 NADH-quinone oxidoreductase subunit J [Alphaproteobacteria bacterium]MDA7999978.1 NADH-quinone oxidoreductase subunit J [Alphaproteobacteria bacterium]MDA8003417.1 NADH-quinone oxidoreductase subunit J [Alphaproteobacteria bacterium]MDA8005230.1 NADH-quinone oxidoreductase subunit J [Alphaproteobacteria bacterium]